MVVKYEYRSVKDRFVLGCMAYFYISFLWLYGSPTKTNWWNLAWRGLIISGFVEVSIHRVCFRSMSVMANLEWHMAFGHQKAYSNKPTASMDIGRTPSAYILHLNNDRDFSFAQPSRLDRRRLVVIKLLLVVLVELVVEFLWPVPSQHSDNFDVEYSLSSTCPTSECYELTLGRLTFGTTTLCSALGASFGAFDGSPPGWYWYLPDVFVSHGREFGAMLTGISLLEDVGFRAAVAEI